MERNLFELTLGDGSAELLCARLKNLPAALPVGGLRRGSRLAQWVLRAGAAMVGLMAALISQCAQAQAPDLLWTRNVGAQVFAVDTQTNVYANSNGTIKVLDGTGVPLQTNTLCSVTNGLAQRDGLGNIYLSGSFDGNQNFGGTNLAGGWWVISPPDPPQWNPGYPTCYLAKYASNGSPQWAVSFGHQAARNFLTDLIAASNGWCYAGYSAPTSLGVAGRVVRFDNAGAAPMGPPVKRLVQHHFRGQAGRVDAVQLLFSWFSKR